MQMEERLAVQAQRCLINKEAGRLRNSSGKLKIANDDFSVTVEAQRAEANIEAAARQLRGNFGL
jgi:hypothetical protein